MRRIHFVFALLVVLVFLNMRSTAQIKIEVQGGSRTQPQQAPARSAASSQPSKKLTNQDIIDMAALKLSDDVIIEKIQQHGGE